MKKRVVIAAALGGVVAIIGISEAMGWPYLRGPVIRAVESRVDAPVMLSNDFHLRLFIGAGVKFSEFRIGQGERVVLSVTDLHARWSPLAPWKAWRSGSMPFTHLQARAVQGTVERDQQGRIQFTAWRHPSRSKRQSLPLTFQSARINQLNWTLIDLGSDSQVQVVGSGALGVGTANEGFDLDASGSVREGPVKARIIVTPNGNWQQWASVSEVNANARVLGTFGRSRMNFDGTIWPAGALPLQGTVAFQAPSLGDVGDALGLTLPRTPPFFIAGELGYGAKQWRITTTRFEVGASKLGVDMVLDTAQTVPHLKGVLRGSSLRLQDLGPAIGATGTDPGAIRRERVIPDRPFDVPSLSAMNATVRVDIASLDFGSRALGPLKGLTSDVLLNDGVLRLEQVQGSTSGGTLRGAAQVKAAQKELVFSTRLAVRDVRIEDWVRALQRAGASPYLAGRATLVFEGEGQGRSTAQILGSLNGRLQAQLREGRASHLGIELAGLDAAQSLGVLFRGDKSLTIQCAQLSAPVAQGMVLLRDGQLDTPDSLVLVNGVVNLKDELLALKGEVKPKDFSPLSLRAPILVGGSFAKPSVGVEARVLVPKLLGALALGLVSPPLALAPLLDFGEAVPAPECPRLSGPSPGDRQRTAK
jgi:hypothetical protein